MSRQTRSISRISLCLLTGILLVYVVLSLISPIRQMSLYNEKYSFLRSDSLARIPVNREEANLMMQNAYLGASVQMASGDSVGLCINLPDSTISISIRGVMVHEARVSSYLTGVFFTKIHPGVRNAWLEKPAISGNFISTITKEPIMRIKAPRDTIEAAKMAIKQDTSDNHAVYFILSTDQGYDIFIGQSEKDFRGAGRAKRMVLLKYKLSRGWSNLKSMAGMKIPEYRPLLRCSIPRKDARVIFRALPLKAQVVTALPHQ